MSFTKNFISVACLASVAFAGNAGTTYVPSAAVQKQIANLNSLLKASQAHYASIGAFNTQYAKSVCGASYSSTSRGINCAVKSLDGPAYQTALNNYNKGYASSTVIQHTIYDLQHPGHFYSDSNFSLGK